MFLKDPCASLEAGQTCTDKFAADFEIISNDVSSDAVMDRIVKAFVEFADLINKLGRGSLNFDPSTVSVGETPRGVVGADNSELELQDGSASIPMVIGAVAGGLAFILLLVLVARRNNDSDDERISHLKLEEDNEDALLREYASTGSMRSEEDHYERRNVHVVGEADSIFSGWTGYTKNGQSGDDMDAHHGDVHKCSSATCEVCEQRRQQGIQFIPTSSLLIPHLPYDTERQYIADDTVLL